MVKTLTYIAIGVGSAAVLYGGNKLLKYVAREWSREAVMKEVSEVWVDQL
jgi:hypothetical protein